MTTIQNGGYSPKNITWGGVQIPADQIADKGKIQIGNSKTIFYYVDFKSGAKAYYQESKGGKMESTDLETHVSSTFEGIKGLSIEGSQQKSDGILINNCNLGTVNVQDGDERDIVYVKNSQNGTVVGDYNDRVFIENCTNVQSNRPTN